MSSVRDLCVLQSGKQPLDATSVHPESYEAAKELLKKLGCQEEDISGGNLKGLSKNDQRQSKT